MQEERRQLLRQHQPALAKDMDESEVAIYLHSHNILTESAFGRISKETNGQLARLDIIKEVARRGDVAFDLLYKALLYSHQEHLAQLLRPLVSPSVLFSNENNNGSSRSAGSFDAMFSMGESSRGGVVPRGGGPSVDSRENLDPTAWVDNSWELGGEHEYSIDGVDSNDTQRQQLDRFHANKHGIYPNFTSPKGMCVIINNRNFTTMAERKGTEVDAKNLMNLFKNLGYTVFMKNDLAAKDMIAFAKDFAQHRSHAQCDSLFFIILTHGENQVLIGSDGEHVSVDHLLSQFNSVNAPHLAGKPKIFLFQACRGERYDSGIVTKELDETDSRGGIYPDAFSFNPFSCLRPMARQTEGVRLPVESDFLVAYATAASYVSWRNSLHGSWFIQAVCEVFSKHAKDLDLGDMLTLVNRRVAHGKSTSGMQKQTPDFHSRLRKKFYFFPGVTLKEAKIL